MNWRTTLFSGCDAKRLIKLAVSVLYYCEKSLSNFASRLFGRSQNDLIILYYHGIPHAHRANFVRQMDQLQRAARVLPASYRGTLPLGRRNVAITFDDAYISVAQNALPELEARGFHSTIFVPADLLGSNPTWKMEDGSPDFKETVMSAEQIAKLSSPLVTIGSHTRTHPHLSQTDRHHAREEIEGSRLKLQSLTSEEIRLFAFPYGDHDAAIIELCKSAGYDYAFSTTPHAVDTLSPEFVRGRVKVDPFDGPLEFFLKYNGAYAWVSHISSLKRKLRNWDQLRGNKRSLHKQH